MHRLQVGLALALCVGLAVPGWAQAQEWRSFTDPRFGTRYDIPFGFQQAEAEAGRLAFEETEGPAQIVMHSGDIPNRKTLAEFREGIERADWIRDISYRAGGDQWLVISGHYKREAGETEPMIFYAKFMLSRDGARYTSMEVVYPIGRKREFDPVVTRLEKSLRAPS